MVEFINAFMSYGLLMLIIVALCAAGGFAAVTLRKKKDEKADTQAPAEGTEEE